MRSISTSQTAKGPPQWEGLDKLRDVLFVQVELAAELCVHQVLNGQHLIQGVFIHESLVQAKIAKAVIGPERSVKIDVALGVANEWLEIAETTNGADDVLAADIGVCSNAFDTNIAQGLTSTAHGTE